MALWYAIHRAASIAVPLTNRGRVPAISKRFYSPKEMSELEMMRELISKLKDKDPYLQLPRWAINDGDYGDDDQDDFNRILDAAYSDFEDDEEEDEQVDEPHHTHQS